MTMKPEGRRMTESRPYECEGCYRAGRGFVLAVDNYDGEPLCAGCIAEEKRRCEQDLAREERELAEWERVLRIVTPIMVQNPTMTLREAAESLGYALVEHGDRLYFMKQQ